MDQVGGALLFVPADRPERFATAVATGADHVIVDLEDAVGPGSKAKARDSVVAWLASGAPALVRVNGVDDPHHVADLAAVGTRAEGIVLPKAEDPARVAQVVRASRAPVLALIETPAGVLAAAAIAGAGVRALVLGNVDLATCLGVDPASHRALLTARSTLVLASAAAGLERPVDGVTVSLHDPEALAADLAQSRQLGFGGKLCVHPRQVEPTRRAFAPTEEEVRWAREVVQASEAAERSTGLVALAVGGQLVDAPVLARARAVLDRSRP